MNARERYKLTSQARRLRRAAESERTSPNGRPGVADMLQRGAVEIEEKLRACDSCGGPPAYRFPIGGGWAHACVECKEKADKARDENPDPDVEYVTAEEWQRLLRPVRWTFDFVQVFDGFTDDTTWNGFLNVWVTPQIHAEVVKTLGEEAWEDFRSMTPGRDGLFSYANGYATAEVVMRPVRWGFYVFDRIFDGFTNETETNGWLNVWVAPEVHAEVLATMRQDEDFDEAIVDTFAGLSVDEQTGLISYAETEAPIVEYAPRASAGRTTRGGAPGAW